MTQSPREREPQKIVIEAVGDADIPAVAPAIAAIFNREIREGTALWNTAERSVDAMAAWIEARLASGFPVLLALEPAAAASPQRRSILGYGGFGPFRPHDGYAATVEHSLYVEPAAQRRGIGGRLLTALEAEARRQKRHVMIGGADADNAASIALHRAHGFSEVARLPEVGRKFDRWLTLVLLQKVLD